MRLKMELSKEKNIIEQAFSFSEKDKAAYKDLYPFLRSLFLLQLDAKGELNLELPETSAQVVKTKWSEGFPLLKRWEFPIDCYAAEKILARMEEYIPSGNQILRDAHAALTAALNSNSEHKKAIWASFMQHDWEPWEEWVNTSGKDMASVFFWARSGLQPSLEWTAQQLLNKFPLPNTWLKGYCPICGSLPSVLFVQGEGERRGHCSWCGSDWSMYRLQCPNCDNRHHESLGYIYIEAESHYSVHYCTLCRTYFKQIDSRQRIEPLFFPLEEWTTLHLDLLAQRAGWKQPESPSPVVYGEKA
jgi:FdhE protein